MSMISFDDIDSEVPVFEEAGPSGFQEARVPERVVPIRRRRLVLGVSGTEGAVNIPSLVEELLGNHDVWVICTKDSSMYVRTIVFDARSVAVTDEDERSAWTVERMSLHETVCNWADYIFVAPASADLLSRVAAGFCDDLLTRTIRSFRGPVFLILDMDPGTYSNEITDQHVAIVRGRRYRVMSPPRRTDNRRGRMGGMDDVRDWIVHSINS